MNMPVHNCTHVTYQIQDSGLFTFWNNCYDRLMVLSHFCGMLTTKNSYISVNIQVGERYDINGQKKGVFYHSKI